MAITVIDTNKKRSWWCPTAWLWLFFAGVAVFLGAQGVLVYQQYQRTTLLQTDFPERMAAAGEGILDKPVKIEISSIEVNLPVRPGYVRGRQWTTDDTAVLHLDSSAVPGETGNVIMYGHNSRRVLGFLGRVRRGEEIGLTSASGVVRRYVIQDVYLTSPADAAPVAPTASETLTIYSCAGLLDRQRLVVRALPA